MDIKIDTEEKIIDGIYDAALNTSLWNQVLSSIKDSLNADQCNIVFYDQANPQRNQLFLGGHYPADLLEEYHKNNIHLDIAEGNKIFKDIPNGTFVDRHSYKYRDSTDGLSKYLRENVNEGPHAGTRLIHNNLSCTFFSATRNTGRKPFCSSDIKFMTLLSKHIKRAITIHHNIKNERDDARLLAECLNLSATGIVVLDSNKEITFLNIEATRILRERSYLYTNDRGKLFAVSDQENKKLQDLLNVVDEKPKTLIINPSINTIPIFSNKFSHPLKVSLIKITRCGAELKNWHFAIFLKDIYKPCHISEDYLKKAYNMTPTENFLAQGLLNGDQITDIAKNRGAGVETMRWHLKSVQQKTNTHSQTELMKLLTLLHEDFSTLI